MLGTSPLSAPWLRRIVALVESIVPSTSRWTRDIITVWENASLGTFGTDLFEGSRAAIPLAAGTYALVTQSGGSKPEYVQNSASPAWRFPTAQVTVYAPDYVRAMSFAQALWESITAVLNTTINNTRYKKIEPVGDIRDMGVDDKGRFRVNFNIIGEKGPSH